MAKDGIGYLANVVRPHVVHEKKALVAILFDYYVCHIELFVDHIESSLGSQVGSVGDGSFACDVEEVEDDAASPADYEEIAAAEEAFVDDAGEIAIAEATFDDDKLRLCCGPTSSVADSDAAGAFAETFVAEEAYD